MQAMEQPSIHPPAVIHQLDQPACLDIDVKPCLCRIVKNNPQTGKQARIVSRAVVIGITMDNFIIMSGLRVARGEFLAWTHADMQTDPADVLKGFEKLLAARDPQNAFLKGRRIARNPLDAFFTFGMSCISSACLGLWLHDINAQPKMFSRRFYETMKSPPDDFSLDLYVYYLARKSGMEFLIQPVDFAKRRHGEAKGGGTLAGKWRLIKRTWAYIFKLRCEITSGQR